MLRARFSPAEGSARSKGENLRAEKHKLQIKYISQLHGHRRLYVLLSSFKGAQPVFQFHSNHATSLSGAQRAATRPHLLFLPGSIPLSRFWAATILRNCSSWWFWVGLGQAAVEMSAAFLGNTGQMPAGSCAPVWHLTPCPIPLPLPPYL